MELKEDILDAAPPDQRPFSQLDLFDVELEPARKLIEELIAATELYSTADACKQLLDFVARLRGFAPFNAMLLHIQKPGLTYAATARDWRDRFGRRPKRDARPLVVLRTMGPVDFVFDIQDTEGPELPRDAYAFPAMGEVSLGQWSAFVDRLEREDISVASIDRGDASAGYIALTQASRMPKQKHCYRVAVNANHSPAVRLVTLLHELAHLFLGHLGHDPARQVPDRRGRSDGLMEVEAECVAYIAACRNGVRPRSETYLADFRGEFEKIDLWAVMRATNRIEQLLDLPASRRGQPGR